MKRNTIAGRGQVILITGASSGFGKTTAASLVDEGYIVYGTSRKAMEDTDGIKMLEMDLTRPESIQRGIDRILTEQGHIDILINNAGLGISGALELTTGEEIDRQMNTNFLGVVQTCKAILPVMRKAGQGTIINISSIGGLIAVPFQGYYSASKFAVEGFSEALQYEVRPFGIRVCLVEPGDFCTNFTANRCISDATLAHPDYQMAFTQTIAAIEEMERKGTHPDKLARTISRLIKKRRPPFRTKTGPIEQVLFARCKGWLPDRLVAWVVRKGYKLK